ncbi:MAG: enoyl-CoA hydratase/isomerase family protein [Planctomycetota bacterium]
MAESRNHLQIRIDAPVATVILDRPERRNALSRTLVQSLIECLDDLHHEGQVRSVILTGAGDAFCSGTDLYEMKESIESPQAFKIWHEETQAFLSLIEAMLRFPKPIIGAINGPVAGSGVAVMLATDFVVASDKATLLLPESRRGLSAGLTTPLLSFRVGTSVAAQLLMTGTAVNAQRSASIGLFHEVVPEDFVWAKSFEMANQCAAGARESHQMAKQLLNETIGETLMMQLNIGAANMAAARTTEAAKEGVNAFLEKREPKW